MVLSFLMQPTIQSVTGFLLLIGTLGAQAVTLTWDDVVGQTQNSNPQIEFKKRLLTEISISVTPLKINQKLRNSGSIVGT
jgi:hypothetical protein